MYIAGCTLYTYKHLYIYEEMELPGAFEKSGGDDLGPADAVALHFCATPLSLSLSVSISKVYR